MQTGNFNQYEPKIELKELKRYRRALLSVLRRVNINSCDPQFKTDLKTVYRLISKMGVVNKRNDSGRHEVKQGRMI